MLEIEMEYVVYTSIYIIFDLLSSSPNAWNWSGIEIPNSGQTAGDIVKLCITDKFLEIAEIVSGRSIRLAQVSAIKLSQSIASTH